MREPECTSFGGRAVLKNGFAVQAEACVLRIAIFYLEDYNSSIISFVL
ncbi:hypothetical protein CLOM621_07862 [Clostridium sp. M62/1]|nr:hypothetical protein CLOM621_07862 [Clostridium sp. M62/1]